MRRHLLPLALLAACGAGSPSGQPWRSSSPIHISVGASVPIPHDEAVRALKEGAAQFGLTVTEQPVWGQGIAVEWIEFCRCRACTPYTVAYVTQDDYRTIHVCARAALTVSDLGAAVAADGILKHELGHVLGQPDHLEGPDTAMMTGRQLDQRPPVRKLTDADLDFVCTAGGVVSARCRK